MPNTQLEQSASAGRPGERLRDYDRLKLELGQTLQTVLHLVGGQEHQEQHRSWRELLTRLAEDRFMLAVVGQFNRGKSSLMNAILGLDRLPVGVVPLTSVITKVAYGNPERVLIEFEGGRLRTAIRMDQLGDYVTEEGNPANKKRIAAAEAQLPSEFLRRGLFFVDTPGVGSAIAANTATTEHFLPEADAVIFVMSFDSPLSRDELEFLQRVGDHVRKIFFVVNKADLAPQEHRSRVLSFVREQIEQETGLHEPRLFAVSALVGLEAKLTGVPERLADSGLPALEAKLIEFLTTEKTTEFLLRLCERALSLLADLDSVALAEAHKATFDDVAARIVSIRDRLIGTAGEGLTPISRRVVARALEPEVVEAVRKACRVCTCVADVMFRFMAKFQYQIVISAQERLALASRGGLCPLHTWQYSEIASPQGIAASFPAVLTTLSKRLSGLAESGDRNALGAETKRLLTKPEQCRACREQFSAEERVIEEIVREITHVGGRLPKTPVLCLPHLSALLRNLPDPEVASHLVAFEAAVLERLAENMERYALKHDALRRGLQSEDECVAYHQALSQLVGDKRLQAPWRVQSLL
ncbi:MAG TPA: dynamin family protein [Terriglobia bacterium]|nr:dynamin family protein [Terriglobia bacterium]